MSHRHAGPQPIGAAAHFLLILFNSQGLNHPRALECHNLALLHSPPNRPTPKDARCVGAGRRLGGARRCSCRLSRAMLTGPPRPPSPPCRDRPHPGWPVRQPDRRQVLGGEGRAQRGAFRPGGRWARSKSSAPPASATHGMRPRGPRAAAWRPRSRVRRRTVCLAGHILGAAFALRSLSPRSGRARCRVATAVAMRRPRRGVAALPAHGPQPHLSVGRP